jgi:hypothetical protein
MVNESIKNRRKEMFCVKCGSEIDEEVQFCPKCGNAIKSTSEDSVNFIEHKRHGFTSFWLIFSLISFVIGGSIYLFSPALITQYYKVSSNLIMLYGIVSILGVVGNILLLCWKKIGFWVFIGISIVSLLLNILIGMNIGQILFGLIGIAVMWGVLHIRKNGKTTWEQLV